MGAAPAYSRYADNYYAERTPRPYARGGRFDVYDTFGNTARQRAYDACPEPAYRERYAQPERDPRRNISVVPGGAAEAQTIAPAWIFLAKTAAVVLVFLALLGFARITISSATVTTALETRELSSQIDTARSAGNVLEVQQSSLSNPTRIKDAATLLGMSAPAYVANIDLSGDLVVVDAAGALSLSGSAAVLAQG